MPISETEFNDLVTRVGVLEAQIVVLQDELDETESGSIEDRLATIESSMASINQILALLTNQNLDFSAHEARIDTLEDTTDKNVNAIKALKKWRLDLRHELVYEEAVNGGGGTIWELSQAYDETSMFVVFQADLTLVDPGVITMSDPDGGVFTSGVVLTGGVHVIYMKGIPEV